MVDIQQQFCLKWNNYQSTLPHIFHRLWERGLFVDVSLIVEGKKIDCHKVILSACSSYFEQLLSDHATHPHPLILLHDIPYAALESLVMFMYKGEINVSHDQLSAVLKVADTLKIKGLADSEAIYNFARFKLMSREFPKVTSSAPHVPFNYPFNQKSTMPPFTGINGLPTNGRNFPPMKGSAQLVNNISGKYNASDARSNKPPKKRCRQEESTTPLPPSPPISLGEIQNTEQPQPSSPQEIVPVGECIKVELEEETDNELQIDESVGHSTPDCADSDSRSAQNTPVPDMDSVDSDERTETAHSLAALATQGSAFRLLDHQLVIPKMPSSNAKSEKGTNVVKNGERSYTIKDLEDGIEAVLSGNLTPAKAIAKFKVPRRTFFRRLSTVRKSRGIPSSKENSSEYLITGQRHSPSPLANDNKMSQLPVIVPSIVAKDASFISNLAKVANKGNLDAVHSKKDKSLQGVMATGNVFSLLNVAAAANNNYDYYLNYFKLKAPQGKEIMIEGKDHIMDDNRNLSSSESVLSEASAPLAVHNGSSK